MSDIHAGTYKLDHRRRPYVHTKVTSWHSDGWNPSGVELVIDRAGVWLAGWYDSMVGIEGFSIPWELFDSLRRQVESKPISSSPTAEASADALAQANTTLEGKE